MGERTVGTGGFNNLMTWRKRTGRVGWGLRIRTYSERSIPEGTWHRSQFNVRLGLLYNCQLCPVLDAVPISYLSKLVFHVTQGMMIEGK